MRSRRKEFKRFFPLDTSSKRQIYKLDGFFDEEAEAVNLVLLREFCNIVVLGDGWWPDLSPGDYSWTGTSCLNGQEIGLNIESFDFPKRWFLKGDL
jgi:hypothetical protein